MFDISVRADVKGLERKLSDLAYRQMPFATATALTALGKIVQKGEQKAMGSVFDRPTPFTINSVGVKPARKNDLQATVFVKDIAASYLAPYEVGGNHKLIGKGKTWLNPKDHALLNQYGNLSKGKLAALKARADVFVGTVKTKDGQTISGVWQRPTNVKRVSLLSKKGTRLRGVIPQGSDGHMKLLVRFGDAEPVKEHLDYHKRAEQLVRANFNAEMGKALAKAIATAK